MSDLGLRPRQAYPDGGYEYILDQSIQAISIELLTNIAKSVRNGSTKLIDMTTSSYPIQLCYPITYLELIGKEYAFLCEYMEKAVATKNPIERFQHVITGIVAGYHIPIVTCENRGCLQFRLGETWQAKTKNNCVLEIECISRFPPVMV